MKKVFNQLSEKLFSLLKPDEYLVSSFYGENSQFIRFNAATIRQTGLVDDGSMILKYMHNGRTCTGDFTMSGNSDMDFARGKEQLDRMRTESKQIPKDPFQVIPSNTDSSNEITTANGLSREDAAEAILPVISGADFVGIWSSGKIFRGNSNSLGQSHWFETESFSLDYSLVTPEHQMVKGCFAGTDWDQNEFEKYVGESKKKLSLLNRKPVKVKTGKYRTWFESAAVADFLSMFSWNGISEASLRQGCSGFGRMRNGDTRLSAKFTLSEDFRKGYCPKFNSDGEISDSRLTLINSGELKNTLVSSRSEKEYGIKSNFAANGEYLRSPVMEKGSLSQSEVVSKIDKGLYLSNIHYLNWSDNAAGRITGLTRYACFWVENGEIVAPIETMRFDDTFYNFFGKELEDVEDRASVNPAIETYGGREPGAITCPGILVGSFALTL
tara:strand:- start:2483 stop:3805 length:1323 start_codon:yes stop_codon:yes gene_type:complete